VKNGWNSSEGKKWNGTPVLLLFSVCKISLVPSTVRGSVQRCVLLVFRTIVHRDVTLVHFANQYCKTRSRYSDWLQARRPRGRSSSPGRVKNFLFTSSRPGLASTEPPVQRVPGILSPGLKRAGHEADHSPPASAKVKKMWIYTSTLPYAFMARLVKHRDNFTLPYLYCKTIRAADRVTVRKNKKLFPFYFN
jgi:hypothetical protein